MSHPPMERGCCVHSLGKHCSAEESFDGVAYCSKCADWDDESAGDAQGYSRHAYWNLNERLADVRVELEKIIERCREEEGRAPLFLLLDVALMAQHGIFALERVLALAGDS